jgi:AraC-like DNA-binding protein
MRRAVPEEFFRFGFGTVRGRPEPMRSYHRHDEVEIDLVLEGDPLRFRFGSREVSIRAGTLCAFWGAVPHRQLVSQPRTRVQYLTVPLADVLRWRLPNGLGARLLGGELLTDASRPAADRALFDQWLADLGERDANRRATALLEIEARLRRLALALPSRASSGPVAEVGAVERMARHAAEHFAEPLRARDVARAAGLNPDYGAALFRRVVGIGLLDYLAGLRIAHAQRLLADTDLAIVDIAFRAGFGSASRFYARFAASCGCSPSAYRRRSGS